MSPASTTPNAGASADVTEQAPGFQRRQIGKLRVTALYDGFVPILAEDLHGEEPERVRHLLSEAYLPPEGDPQTAVIVFLVELAGQRILIDAGSGDALGPDTGLLLTSLTSAGFSPEDIDHVLLTHLHPDHVRGLILPDGTAAFPRAQVHASHADAGHWLDAANTDSATGVQRAIHLWAAEAVAPYVEQGRFSTFSYGHDVLPGVRTVDQHGHTPGHTGYLLGEGPYTVLFWGDTVHCYSVQLAVPEVAVAIDSDQLGAVAARKAILDRTADNRWWVGASHLPFPGIGHLRRGPEGFVWVPAEYRPLSTRHG